MPIKISSHERHVTYICVNKGGLCLGYGFFTKKNASHKCPKSPYYHEDFKVEFNVINNIGVSTMNVVNNPKINLLWKKTRKKKNK